MNTAQSESFAARLVAAFKPTQGGLVQVAESLIRIIDLNREYTPELTLSWDADELQARFQSQGPSGNISVPMRLSHFRAMLARVAVLCNETAADPVSPYGGQGVLYDPNGGGVAYRAQFQNTTSEQQLRLSLIDDTTPHLSHSGHSS